ncbi:MAG: hypothetical protein HY841_08285 [Bacteroidetes bacterium]|nr:hypothetical protein [Bacteroidota bacterium]
MKNYIQMPIAFSLIFIFSIIFYGQKIDSVENNTTKTNFSTLYIYHPKDI